MQVVQFSIVLVGICSFLIVYSASLISLFVGYVVFSSGVGFGEIISPYDDTWDFVCVRGPRSAELLGSRRRLAFATARSCSVSITLRSRCQCATVLSSSRTSEAPWRAASA
jgi:hypothetical protein